MSDAANTPTPKKKRDTMAHRLSEQPRKSCSRWTSQKEARFFELLETTGISMTGAAHSIGMSHSAVYLRRQKDPEFAERLERARDGGADCMEDALLKIGVTHKNPTALIFLLNGRRPEVYRQRIQNDLTNSDGSLAGLFAEAMTTSGDAASAHRDSGNGHDRDPGGDSPPQ